MNLNERKRLEEFAVGAEIESGEEILLEVPNADMMPTMREFYDTVALIQPQNPLKKNDVVLYYGNDGKPVLSRIVYINNGTYSLSADGQKTTDYNITDTQIVGVMTSFDRKGKKISADNKYYQYYLMLLPVVKAIYGIYSSLKTKAQDFINFLFKK